VDIHLDELCKSIKYPFLAKTGRSIMVLATLVFVHVIGLNSSDCMVDDV
jgi:hypothetical protein